MMTGDGTQESPFLIASADDMAELEGKSGYVEITADIDYTDMLATSGTNGIEGIVPGGALYINGNGHSLKNFYQEASTSGGIFTGTFSGSVYNLSVENAYIMNASPDTSYCIGIFASYLGDCSFERVNISGQILGSDTTSSYAGGFGGLAAAGTSDVKRNISFKACKVNVNFSETYKTGGFLCGNTYLDIIFDDCISACKMIVHSNSGGFSSSQCYEGTNYFIGCISQCDIECKASGTGIYLGGFDSSVTGYSTKTSFVNCASICNLKGINNKGYGFCYSNKASNFVQSYCKGNFKNLSEAGGLEGKNIYQSYSACTYENVTTIYPLRFSGEGSSSFFDADLLAEGQTASENTEQGTTTANLKSASWLREQGWAI